MEYADVILHSQFIARCAEKKQMCYHEKIGEVIRCRNEKCNTRIQTYF